MLSRKVIALPKRVGRIEDVPDLKDIDQWTDHCIAQIRSSGSVSIQLTILEYLCFGTRINGNGTQHIKLTDLSEKLLFQFASTNVSSHNINENIKIPIYDAYLDDFPKGYFLYGATTIKFSEKGNNFIATKYNDSWKIVKIVNSKNNSFGSSTKTVSQIADIFESDTTLLHYVLYQKEPPLTQIQPDKHELSLFKNGSISRYVSLLKCVSIEVSEAPLDELQLHRLHIALRIIFFVIFENKNGSTIFSDFKLGEDDPFSDDESEDNLDIKLNDYMDFLQRVGLYDNSCDLRGEIVSIGSVTNSFKRFKQYVKRQSMNIPFSSLDDAMLYLGNQFSIKRQKDNFRRQPFFDNYNSDYNPCSNTIVRVKLPNTNFQSQDFQPLDIGQNGAPRRYFPYKMVIDQGEKIFIIEFYDKMGWVLIDESNNIFPLSLKFRDSQSFSSLKNLLLSSSIIIYRSEIDQSGIDQNLFFNVLLFDHHRFQTPAISRYLLEPVGSSKLHVASKFKYNVFFEDFPNLHLKIINIFYQKFFSISNDSDKGELKHIFLSMVLGLCNKDDFIDICCPSHFTVESIPILNSIFYYYNDMNSDGLEALEDDIKSRVSEIQSCISKLNALIDDRNNGYFFDDLLRDQFINEYYQLNNNVAAFQLDSIQMDDYISFVEHNFIDLPERISNDLKDYDNRYSFHILSFLNQKISEGSLVLKDHELKKKVEGVFYSLALNGENKLKVENEPKELSLIFELIQYCFGNDLSQYVLFLIPSLLSKFMNNSTVNTFDFFPPSYLSASIISKFMVMNSSNNINNIKKVVQARKLFLEFILLTGNPLNTTYESIIGFIFLRVILNSCSHPFVIPIVTSLQFCFSDYFPLVVQYYSDQDIHHYLFRSDKLANQIERNQNCTDRNVMDSPIYNAGKFEHSMYFALEKMTAFCSLLYLFNFVRSYKYEDLAGFVTFLFCGYLSNSYNNKSRQLLASSDWYSKLHCEMDEWDLSLFYDSFL